MSDREQLIKILRDHGIVHDQLADALLAAGFGDVAALRDNLRQANAMYAGVCVENVALAAQVARVEAYRAHCRMLRMEPSTAGLTEALAPATPAAEGGA